MDLCCNNETVFNGKLLLNPQYNKENVSGQEVIEPIIRDTNPALYTWWYIGNETYNSYGSRQFIAKSETKKSPKNSLKWGDLRPFRKGENPKVKVKKQALIRHLDRILGRYFQDYCRKSLFQATLDNRLIYLPDLQNYVASKSWWLSLARRLDSVVSNPKKCMDLEGKKDCPEKKLQSAKKVLEERKCNFCSSDNVIGWGKRNGHKRIKCKDCGKISDLNKSFPKMKTNYRIIATALDLYFEGLSLRKVSRQIKKLYGEYVSQVTIWNWIQKYTPQVKEFTDSLTPKTKRGIWHVDETAIKIKGKKGIGLWYWDIIDHDTRFVVGSHISKYRFIEDAQAVFSDAKIQIKDKPNMVICDGLYAYRRGLNKTYGQPRYSKIKLIQKAGIAKEMPSNNNRIERYHNEIKERTKVMRGMQNPMGILDGFRIHHNFIREHQTLGTTPARISGIRLPMEDGWGDLIQFSEIWKNS